MTVFRALDIKGLSDGKFLAVIEASFGKLGVLLASDLGLTNASSLRLRVGSDPIGRGLVKSPLPCLCPCPRAFDVDVWPSRSSGNRARVSAMRAGSERARKGSSLSDRFLTST